MTAVLRGLVRSAAGAVALGLILLAGSPAGAASPPLPQFGPDVHIGIAGCAGSTCHGAIEPWKDSNVLQNEFTTWERDDRHSKAYEVLLNERSKRIARNLGLEAAHTASLCLDCHANNPAQNLRARQFQVSDGVGCEACHGASTRWLGIHVSGRSTHEQNVAAGMFPTEDPAERARLCVSCHFGEERKFVNHRIMGAGHPRMSFELDTFTAIQPAHYQVDDDYVQRKKLASGVQTWAIGQAYALSATLDAMVDPKRGRDGAFPELVLFDCQACHHPMSNLRWEPRSSTGLGPGVVRFNDANLVMLRVITQRTAPEIASELTDRGRALHQATMQGPAPMLDAAKALRETASKLVAAFAARNFTSEDVQALLAGVTAEGLKGEYVDYAAAEQATMALSSIVSAMQTAKLIDDKQYKALGDALNKCYDAVAKDDEYQPREFKSALEGFRAAIPRI